MGYYQSIGTNKGSRDCEERWEVIKPYIPEHGVVLDIGCAEGFFCKRIAEETKCLVVGLEKSKNCLKRLNNWYTDYYKGKVVICNTTIDDIKAQRMAKACDWVNMSMLLSVLHWIPNPGEVLKHVSSFSEQVLVELPDLEDTRACGQAYMNELREIGDIKTYLESCTGRDVTFIKAVKAHTSATRNIWLIGGDVERTCRVPHVDMKLPTAKDCHKYPIYKHTYEKGVHTFNLKGHHRLFWKSGINLATLNYLNVIKPTKEWFLDCARAELEIHKRSKPFKGDARYRNIVVERDGVYWIDLTDKGGKNRYEAEILAIGQPKERK